MDWGAIVKPSFFLVGAAKSGTTALAAWMDEHPELYLSPIKEPNFFSTDIDPDGFREEYKAYVNGVWGNTQHQGFIREENDYKELFKGNDSALIAGECSTSYLFSKEAAERISRYQPDARIIMILRNPTARAHSHYRMAVQMGLEQRDFDMAWHEDLAMKERRWGVSELYADLGYYDEQLERYLDHFPSDRILVLFHEDFISRPQEVLDKASAFLGVSAHPALLESERNKSRVPKNKQLHAWLKSGWISRWLAKVPSPLKSSLQKLYYGSSGKELTEELESEIRSHYTDRMERLQVLVTRCDTL